MNKQGVKSYIGIVIGLILSFNVGLYAWSGIQAQDGDKLSVAKWNEMTSGVWGRFGAAMHYTGGNVGIGTSAPDVKLHVNDRLIKISGVVPGLILSDTTVGGKEFTLFSGSPGAGFFKIRDNSSSLDRFIIDPNGSFGLGPAIPSLNDIGTVLHLNTNSDETSAIHITNGITGNSPIDGTVLGHWKTGLNNDFSIRTYENKNIRIGTNNAERIIIQSDGKVGIGNTNPYSRLHVNSDISSTDLTNGYGQLILGGSTNSSKRLILGYDTTANFGYLQGNTFGSTWDNIVLNPRGGNIGIGIMNPDTGLHVVKDNGYGYAALFQNSISSGKVGIGSFGTFAGIQGLTSGGQAGVLVLQPNGGSIGIATSSPSYTLHVNGTAAGTSWTNLSDQRYKKDIKTIESPLDKISKLRGVTFNWKTGEFKDKNFPKGNQVGFIAQEVEKVLPQIVTTDKDGYKGVEYSNMTAVLVEAVKELKKENDNKENKINELIKRIEILERKK